MPTAAHHRRNRLRRWRSGHRRPRHRNEYGDFDEAAYEGNLYLTINGRLYGSLYIRHDADAGHPTITLGQYDPAAQQWEPRNEIGPEASDDATPVVTATDAAVNR